MQLQNPIDWQWTQAPGAPKTQGDLLLKSALMLTLEDKAQRQPQHDHHDHDCSQHQIGRAHV